MQDLGHVTPLLSSFCHPYDYWLSQAITHWYGLCYGLWTSHVNLQTPREMCIFNIV